MRTRARPGAVLAMCIANFALGANTPADDWLRFVAPVISTAERTNYESMTPEARQNLREHFWDDKSITLGEFSARTEYIDSNFGSGKRGSGISTDQGRVYLSLGPPNRVTHLSSSRSFVPLEIWYYANASTVGASSELRLVFYQKNATGIPKLYSPNVDTIRELLLPQPGTRGIFGPNETTDMAAIQTRLAANPVESEVLEAATSVSPGIRGEENDSVLLRAMSPQTALRMAAMKPQVRSRVLSHRQDLDVIQTISPYGNGAQQVDLHWKGQVTRCLHVEVTDATGSVYASQLNFNFERPEKVHYLHRLDLLPGQYTVLMTADGVTIPYAVNVAAAPEVGDLVRVKDRTVSGDRATPLQFGGRHLEIAADGSTILLPATRGTVVSWVLREGNRALWKRETVAEDVAIIDLPISELRPGSYRLEAAANGESRSMSLSAKEANSKEASASSVVSFNVNLAGTSRLNFVGRQLLRRGFSMEARKCFELSLERTSAGNTEALVGLSKLEAAAAHWDEARARLRQVLSAQPDNFEALTTMAFVEAGLQDFPVAASFYKRALAVQDAPAVRLALASLPK